MTAIVQGPGPQNKVEAQSPARLKTKNLAAATQCCTQQASDGQTPPSQPKADKKLNNIDSRAAEGKKTDYYDCSKLNLEDFAW